MEKSSIIKIIEDANNDLINGIVFLIGLVIMLLSLWLTIWTTVLLSVGCSIMASAIVCWLTSRYTLSKINIKAIIDRWGLIGIYETRGEMNIDCDEKLETLSSTLDIIAFGLKSFRDSKSDLIEEKVDLLRN